MREYNGRFTFLFVIFYASLVKNVNGGYTCQNGWTLHGHHCYYFSTGEKEWFPSEQYCRKNEGHLVKIEGSSENNWLKQYVLTGQYYWIGAHDSQNEGEWRWISDNSLLSYTDWLPGEPNNFDNKEDCAHFYKDKQWNDFPCHEKEKFICKKQGCAFIANCASTKCRSLADIYCEKCNNQGILYEMDQGNRKCSRTCSWQNRWCWPGNCGTKNYARDCSCEENGFLTVKDDNQARCKLSSSPEILSCRMMVIDSNNDALMSPVPEGLPTHCSNQQDIFGNLQVERIVTNTTFEFQINVSHVPRPSFIDGYAFGITDVSLQLFRKPITDNWIGAHDRDREGDWRWISDNSHVSYTDWHHGQPDNHGNEDCVHTVHQHWNDFDFHSGKNFICEKQGCTLIANCQVTQCRNLADIYCDRCDQQSILYELDQGNRKCTRTCSWENRWCWPGNCSTKNYAKDCSCLENGFLTVKDANQARCEFTSSPEILSCRMMVIDSNNDALMSPVPEGLPTHWSNQQDFLEMFRWKGLRFNSRLMCRMYPDPRSDELLENIPLKTDNGSSITQKLVSFDESIANVEKLKNGERLCLRFLAKGGGHLVSKNIITHHTTMVSYPKTITSRDVCYKFDNASPMHCSEDNRCSADPLEPNNRILFKRNFSVIFTGWEDPSPVLNNSTFTSGIDTYVINMYQVIESGLDQLDVGTSPIIEPIKQTSPVDIMIPEQLPNPAMYVIILEVKDVANNVRSARRFILFDNSSNVVANTNKPIYCTTASATTQHVWQTNYGNLSYSWNDRYYNDKYYHLNLLKPIKGDHHGLITGVYDQISGDLPVSGTKNVHGITMFYFSLWKDGISLYSKANVPDFTTQKLSLTPTLQDGETYLLEVVAEDIMTHTYSESIYTYIDQSGPEITDIWLERDGQKRLYVHNSSDLSKMVLVFNALDIHSGIYSMDWSLGTTYGGSDIGTGSLSVNRLNETIPCPDQSSCYCPSIGLCAFFNFTLTLNSLVHANKHKGNHNRNYHFTLTATNVAQLVHTEHFEVLTDDSPPATGVVSEGPTGNQDIDYTSENSLLVHWDGFIDHESGIKLYKIGLSKKCLQIAEFISHHVNGSDETLIVETSLKTVRLPLTNEGKNFVTVVAYNYAMEPSVPVCSDGVVLDKSPPLIVNLSLQGSSVQESLICSDGKAFLVTGNLTTTNVKSCDKHCVNTTKNGMVSLLRRDATNKTQGAKYCDIRQNIKTIYLPTDLLQLQWSIDENMSQVQDIFVGIGSTDKSKSYPDLIDYQKSPHKNYYKQRHSGLSTGDEIYIYLQITNSAGLLTTTVFGPILIDETPPVCPLTLPVTISDKSVYVHWNSNDIFDAEQEESISSFKYRIGRQENLVSSFNSLSIEEKRDCLEQTRNCFIIELSKFYVFDVEEIFQFIIKFYAFNNAGYYCTVDTDKFYLPSRHPPGHGIVYDVSKNTAETLGDIDVQLESSEFCVSWTGFKHHNEVKYELGVGESHYSDDIVPFHAIENSEIHCENATILEPYARYFVSVKAISSGGTRLATSDGFVVIDETDVLSSLKVFDGEGCHKIERDSLFFWRIIRMTNGYSVEYLPAGFHFYIGKVYTLITNASVSIESQDALIQPTEDVGIFYHYQIVPLKTDPYFFISCIQQCNVSDISLRVLDCVPDVDIIHDAKAISVVWEHDNYQQFISYYEVKLLAMGDCDNTNPVTVAYNRVSGNELEHRFFGLNLDSGCYRFDIRPCIDSSCLQWVSSDGFVMFDPSINDFEISSSLESTQATCSEVHVLIENIAFPASNLVPNKVGIRWSLFRDNSAENQLTEWNNFLYSNQEDNHVLISECIPSPLYPHFQLFTCAEVYFPMDSMKIKCAPLLPRPDPNVFDKTQLYEVDSDAENVRNNLNIIHADNIGEKLTWLHQADIDYAPNNIRIGGIILGMEGRHVIWYLLKGSKVFNVTCEENLDCVATIETHGGFSSFKGLQLESENLYYICANVDSKTESNGRILDGFNTCGNGFLIDENKPSIGKVTLLSEKGYLVDTTTIKMQWEGFHDFHGYTKLGYIDGIAQYKYSVGSQPYGQNIVATKSVGMSQFVILHNLQLKPGTILYGTVTATDHVGYVTSAVSEGVMFDNTAPVIGIVKVGSFLTNDTFIASEINVHWIDVCDNESGIDRIQVGIGSTKYLPDIISFADYMGDSASITNISLLHDGHKYFAIILVTNRAGLSTMAASEPFTFDTSPPTEGNVRDGFKYQMTDVNYQANTTHAGCHWSGFSDPHTGIWYYSVGLGTKPFQNDVRPYLPVGISTEITWTHQFVPGTVYYCSVQACNGAKMCTLVSSDGFTSDFSAPNPGIVHVGIDGHHSKYWAHQSIIQAQWFGFVDTESGINRYEVCIKRLNNSECDIVPFTNFLLSNFMTQHVQLPRYEMLCVVVRAYNHMELFAESVSDYFKVDPTPPVVIDVPVLETRQSYTSHNHISQFDPSLVKMVWKFYDDESPITKHIVSGKTHHQGHTPISDIHLANENHISISLEKKDWLNIGSVFTGTVTACNEAGLCTTADTNEIIIDSTPPHMGGFTEPLTWRFSNITQSTCVNLTVYGFQDIESGIKTYYVTMSRSYSGYELSNGVVSVQPKDPVTGVESVQICTKEIIQSGQKIILSVWAENFAGIYSDIGRVTVTVLSSDHIGTAGSLQILTHSCDAEYCNKDCTCAVIGEKCHNVDVDTACKETNQTNTLDLTILLGSHPLTTLTASSACISANWSITQSQSDEGMNYILRFEWSMGQQDMPVGTGIFDPLIENVWHDIGLRKSVVHCLGNGKHLEHDMSYVVYVRAWTSTSEYTLFKSDHLLVDNTPPSVRRGAFIKENSEEICTSDLDFTTITTTFTACWYGIFFDQSGIHTYHVSLGTTPGGDDQITSTNVGLNTSIGWADLSLSPGTKYYTSVTAVNNVGLHTSVFSDGILIDNENPIPGIVFNTNSFHNSHVQNTNDLGVSFSGFNDRHSGIDSYFVAVQTSDSSSIENETSLTFTNIGLKNRYTFINTSLTAGQWYRFAVKAVDKAGFLSKTIFSPKAVFDDTPPVHFEISKPLVISNTTLTAKQSTLSWRKELTPSATPSVYTLFLSVGLNISNLFAEISFEDSTELHPFRINVESLQSETETLLISSPFYEKSRFISIHIPDITTETELYIQLSVHDNVTLTDKKDDVVRVMQMSPTELQLEFNTVDLESGIKAVYVGLGSYPGGFQIYPLTKVSYKHKIRLLTRAPHGQTVYASVIIENHAGDRNTFYSNPFTMDHTPPVIHNAKTDTSYRIFGNETLTKVKVSWEVEDKESTVAKCTCIIGENTIDEVIYEQSSSGLLHYVETNYISMKHGTDVFVKLTCINSASLKQVLFVDPKQALFLPLDIGNTTVLFDTPFMTSHGLPVIHPTSSLAFTWLDVHNSPDIKRYFYRIKKGNQEVVGWKDAEMRNYVSLKGVSLENNNLYTVEVKAHNYEGIHSNIINGSVLVLGETPSVTGNPPEVNKAGNEIQIDWTDVFSTRTDLLPRYTVRAGSAEGLSDVVRYVETTERYYVFQHGYSGNDVYTVITCYYITGTSTTFSGPVKINYK